MRIVIKGFTILEAVVAMMLTALLVTLVVTGLGFYQRTFIMLTDLGEQVREVNVFYGAMSNDMDRAEKVTYTGEMYLEFSGSRFVSYEILEDKVIRTCELQTDTFFVCGQIEEMSLANDSSALLSFILLHFSIGELVYPVSFHKEYSSGLLLQN